MAEEGVPCIVKLLCLIGIMGVLMMIILLPLSFGDIEYYQYGFIKQKSTGTVFLDEVYANGKHLIGPDAEFKTFQADAHYVTLDKIRAFTSDRLEVQITVHYQYFLRKEDLPKLHRRFDVFYKDVMRTSGVDAVKGSITVFEKGQLISDRHKVEETIYKAVRERLGGKCCRKDCNSWLHACDPDCKERHLCTPEFEGLFADVKYFHMGEVYIPQVVKQQYLRTLTLKEDAEKEKLLQNATVERKKTQSKVQKIKNEAVELREQAAAQSKLIKVTSQANYTAIVESARSQGLDILFTALNITDQGHKNSFDYLRTLRSLDNVHLTVDFQQRIIGGMGNG